LITPFVIICIVRGFRDHHVNSIFPNDPRQPAPLTSALFTGVS